MSVDAYKYNNLILVKNGLSAEGIRQVKNTLDSLTDKLTRLDEVEGLSIPFHLTPKDLLVCHVKSNTIHFYYVSKDIDNDSRKVRYSDAVNAIDARLLYHATKILNNQSDKTIKRFVSAYKVSKINGINLKYNDISLKAETNGDYSQEYQMLNIDNVKDIIPK